MIAAISKITGKDPAAVLREFSTFPRPGGKPFYLLNLAAADDGYLLRTVNDLRDELIRLKARNKGPDLEALDRAADEEAERLARAR